jgi:hypothetical protein
MPSYFDYCRNTETVSSKKCSRSSARSSTRIPASRSPVSTSPAPIHPSVQLYSHCVSSNLKIKNKMSAQLAAASLIDFQSHTTPAKRPSAKLDRHARCCTICRHADRLEIEDAFLHWRPATEIAAEFGLPDRRAVYRHARAAGLYTRRMKNMRVACSYLVEHAERISPNAKQVLDAIRACSLIDSSGTWHEPIRHVIIDHASHAPADPSETPASTPQNSPISTVYSMQLESPATPTKQSPPPSSTVYSSAVPSSTNCSSNRDAQSRAAQADNTVRPTTSVWLKWPDFIRDRFAKRNWTRKDGASAPPISDSTQPALAAEAKPTLVEAGGAEVLAVVEGGDADRLAHFEEAGADAAADTFGEGIFDGEGAGAGHARGRSRAD